MWPGLGHRSDGLSGRGLDDAGLRGVGLVQLSGGRGLVWPGLGRRSDRQSRGALVRPGFGTLRSKLSHRSGQPLDERGPFGLGGGPVRLGLRRSLRRLRQGRPRRCGRARRRWWLGRNGLVKRMNWRRWGRRLRLHRRRTRERRSVLLIESRWWLRRRPPTRSVGWAMCNRWGWWRVLHPRGRRDAELEHQSGPVLRIAEGDRPTVMDEDRGHPHAVDVNPAFAPVDGDPLPAVVVQHCMGGRSGGTHSVEADICSAVAADGHVPANGKGVPARSRPDNHWGSKRLRRHSHHLPRQSC